MSKRTDNLAPAAAPAAAPAPAPAPAPARARAPVPAPIRLSLPERRQTVIRYDALDDLLSPEHEARVVWSVVESLDLSEFHAAVRAVEGGPGRDATDPRVLIALWLYATIEGVGSARELDRLCEECDPYKWLAGGVPLNHHTLSDFRVDHGAALDALLSRVVATLVGKGLVRVWRISQDGTRVRACAGAGSFRRKDRLGVLLDRAKGHVAELRRLLDDPAQSAGLSARKRAAQERAARERRERVEAAVAALPQLEEKQKKLAKKVSQKDKKSGKLKEPRASTSDDQARVMKMSDGGFRPAVNVQLAVDTASRAVVGVDVTNGGVDTGQAEPMRRQVERRTGQKVHEHLMDGGYLVLDEVERAGQEGVSLFVPPKPPRNRDKRGSEYEPRPGDSDAVKAWRARMGSEAGKEIYKQRAATSETVNADAKAHRGLTRLSVRGLDKARCVALWFALAYNVMHFAKELAG
jgi:transposase